MNGGFIGKEVKGTDLAQIDMRTGTKWGD